MLQTETLLLVMLGFSLATLIALFAGRLMWSLAIRIGSRRMQTQIPSSSGELHAERDRLRAEYAMLSQKLGARLESTRMRVAEQMAEVTRTRNRIETLVAELNEKDAVLAAREQEVLGLRARISEQETAAADAQSEIAGLRLELDRNSNEISELHRTIAEKDVPIPDEDSEHVVDAAVAADPLVQQHLAETAHETDDLQNELNRLDATWTKKLGKIKSKTGNPRGGAIDEALAKRIKSLQKDAAR